MINLERNFFILEDPIFKRPDDFKQQRKSIEKQNESNPSQSNLEVLNVIDVCTNRTLFETFKEEILEKSEFSMTLAIGKNRTKKLCLSRDNFSSSVFGRIEDTKIFF